MKTYIKLEGLVFKPDGWTEDQFDQFVDKMTELVESFGSEVQSSVSFERKDELEVEND